ncbi:ATPase AAA+ type core [Macrophomina phaseolina MS6]|uniref:ATPase AAA+ type core n=1 Tax=Macrophomina phaseolina (strain MS6) TaxID=1126212 RepID=K2SB15_MACPH|nr:ATPase AAA+ type core [Macrophomina phaseolina MS6]
MDNARDENAKTGENVEIKSAEPTPASLASSSAEPVNNEEGKSASKKKGKTTTCRKHGSKGHKKRSKKSKKSQQDEDEPTDSDDETAGSDGSESTDEGSETEEEEEQVKKKKSGKKSLKVRKVKGRKDKSKNKTKSESKGKKHRKKPKKYQSASSPDSDDSDSSSSSSSSDSSSSSPSSEEETRHSRRLRRNKKKSRHIKESEESDVAGEGSGVEDADLRAEQLNRLVLEDQRRRAALGAGGSDPYGLLQKLKALDNINKKSRGKKGKKGSASGKRGSTLEFKRVDELWDSKIHNYKLTESAEDPADEFDTYIFTVRRRFDWENKYKNTVVDIKSKLLKEALQEVMKDVKGVSLVEEQPSIDPNMLFLYLEEIRQFTRKTLKARVKKEKKKKIKRRLRQMISHSKVMIRYLDEDYDETKKTLYPMLNAGNITFDLLWALFKPNTIAYTTTYGSVEHPRCFKVDYATKEFSILRGEWYSVEGRYLEYDGKTFGLGEIANNVETFKGPRKITSLSTYPLRYHKDPEGLKKQLLDRGKKFVTMTGMEYRFHKGLAFEKRKKMVLKHNINGRVMIDPAIFRRINPNYAISLVKPKEQDDLFDLYCDCSDEESDDEEGPAEGPQNFAEQEEEQEKFKIKIVYDEKKKAHLVEVPVDEEGNEIQTEKLDKLAEESEGAEGATAMKQEFSEEELLIASPVVLGFAFSEKRWMEFSLSGICDIEWNEGAFESLVLPENQKSIVKALVSSHKFHAAETIDDVVQGKGKGLVFVLHGPPGVGKTLTAEGIADYLKCPLYAVSAGELGTESWRLEQELQKIMDIAHSWGAILLLDEADVFLEKRQVHDIHRNALVSIFLRLLEYFQGILFLTTNRVETFDDAFQSRIHMGIRYDELSHHAKREIWRMFLRKVREMEGAEMMEFREEDYNTLARKELNGRQIKNAVRTAQALAVNMNQKLSMEHIKRVLVVAEGFERDLKGGSGYEDAMRSYT